MRADVKGSKTHKAWEVEGKVETFAPGRFAFKSHSVPLQCGLKQDTSLSLSFPCVKGDNSPNPQRCCEEQ